MPTRRISDIVHHDQTTSRLYSASDLLARTPSFHLDDTQPLWVFLHPVLTGRPYLPIHRAPVAELLSTLDWLGMDGKRCLRLIPFSNVGYPISLSGLPRSGVTSQDQYRPYPILEGCRERVIPLRKMGGRGARQCHVTRSTPSLRRLIRASGCSSHSSPIRLSMVSST